MATVKVRAECPHCSYENTYFREFETATPTVVTCDNEEGLGCGQYFAVSVVVVPIVTVFKVEPVDAQE